MATVEEKGGRVYVTEAGHTRIYTKREYEHAQKVQVETGAPPKYLRETKPALLPSPLPTPISPPAVVKEPTKEEIARTYLETGKVYDPYSKKYIYVSKPPTVAEAAMAAPTPTVTTLPYAAPYRIPPDIHEPTVKVGQRTVTMRELETVAKTWDVPKKPGDPGYVEQFAISAALAPAHIVSFHTGVPLMLGGARLVFGKREDIVPDIKKSFGELGAAVKRGDPTFYGTLAGTLAVTYGIPYVAGKYRQFKTGLAPGERIYQPTVTEMETFGAGELKMKTGAVPYYAAAKGEKVFDVYQTQYDVSGISKPLKDISQGRISLFKFKGAKAGEHIFGFAYDVAVPTEIEGVTTTVGFYDVWKGKTVVDVPTARFYGGYGVFPSTEVELERISGLTTGRARLVGDPTVTGEWTVPGVSWKDPGKEMIQLLSEHEVGGLSITKDAFQPFYGKSYFELTSEVLSTGGGGRQVFRPSFVPGIADLGGGAVEFATPTWALPTTGLVGLGAVAGGRVAMAAEFKPPETQELWAKDLEVSGIDLSRLEREGYVVKRKAKVRLDVATDVMQDMSQGLQSSLRSATKQASRLQTEQALGLESALGLELAQELGQERITGLQQELGLRQKQAQLLITTPIPPPSITPITITPPPYIPVWGAPPLWLPERRRAKVKLRRRKRKPTRRPFIYTPTQLGQFRARRLGVTIPKAPKAVGPQIVGIRPPVKRKKKRGKRAKKKYQKNFWRSLGL